MMIFHEACCLKSWILFHLNAGTFIGVEWLDEEHGIFKIPWTRIGQPNWQKDHEIFKAYALYRHQQNSSSSSGESPPPEQELSAHLSRLKGNFRSAIHKSREFEYEVGSSQLNRQTGNYRVYRVRQNHRFRSAISGRTVIRTLDKATMTS